MKLIISLIILMNPLLLFSMSPRKDYSQLGTELMGKSIKKLERKYQLKSCGIKQGMFKNINLMGFSFEIFRPLTKNEARALAVNCVQEFLQEVNQDETVRPYLAVYPFDAKHVSISIFVRSCDDAIYHPNLIVVSAFNGEIDYSTNNPNNLYVYAVRECESFEDAVKILKGEMEAPASTIK